jgi:histidyl-tRNA synthetase
VYSGEGAQRVAWQHAERLRDLGLRAVMGAGGSFKSQMKKADASGARYALIVGEDEVKAQRVTLKPLRGDGSQETLEVNEVLRRLKQTIQES